MILRLAFCSIIQLLKMFGLDKLESWGKKLYYVCLFHVGKIPQLSKQVTERHREGRMPLWLERNWLCRNVSSGSCQGLLTDTTRQFCDGYLYSLSLPEHPALPAVITPE